MEKTEFTKRICDERCQHSRHRSRDGNGLSPHVFSQNTAMSRQRNVRLRGRRISRRFAVLMPRVGVSRRLGWRTALTHYDGTLAKCH